MSKLFIVEDDEIQRKTLEEGIQSAYPNWNILSASTYEEAVQTLLDSISQQKPFSMFLLDIQLEQKNGDMSGFVLAEQIRSYKEYFKTPIMFLTSIYEKTQFALATYHCYNYITKPYEIDDILYQIEQMIFTGYLEENAITVTDTSRITHRIMQNDIIYIEFKSHQVVLHTTTGLFTTREQTSAEILKQLAGNFVQCHKKYIVNLNFVQSYAKTNRYLTVNEFILPVSRTYKSNIELLLKSKKIL